MLKEERSKIILKLVKDRQIISTAELMQITNFSQSTINRDVNSLVSKQLITKVWGGVKLFDNFNKYQNHLMLPESFELIQDNMIVFIGGSYNKNLNNFFNDKKIQLVTNSISLFSELKKVISNIHLIGGKYNVQLNQCLGDEAIQNISKLNFDLSILLLDAVDDNGIYSDNYDEAEFYQSIISKSKRSIVLNYGAFKQRKKMKLADIKDIEVFNIDNFREELKLLNEK